jgi:hypothetical protein
MLEGLLFLSTDARRYSGWIARYRYRQRIFVTNTAFGHQMNRCECGGAEKYSRFPYRWPQASVSVFPKNAEKRTTDSGSVQSTRNICVDLWIKTSYPRR